MKQYEAVIEVMRKSGGYSTLGRLYREVPEVPGVRWGTKTPFASMRRIVQDPRFFFKIRPGLWALNEFRERLPIAVLAKTKRQREELDHSYYQGLLVEIGNLKKFDTAVPGQDRKKRFLDRPLGELATLSRLPRFGYERFVRCASSVDVVWFNDRRMPTTLFEVEHTTNIKNSLLKFVELQDFAAQFCIVADGVRRREFESKLEAAAFRVLRNRVGFLDYEAVSIRHSRAYEVAAFDQQVGNC